VYVTVSAMNDENPKHARAEYLEAVKDVYESTVNLQQIIRWRKCFQERTFNQ
jgi:hypothetical protein